LLFTYSRSFRLSPESVLNLVDELDPILDRERVGLNDRGQPLTHLQEVCITLHFLASGGFQHTSGTLFGVGKTTSHL
jgi:hypothetical protein